MKYHVYVNSFVCLFCPLSSQSPYFFTVRTSYCLNIWGMLILLPLCPGFCLFIPIPILVMFMRLCGWIIWFMHYCHGLKLVVIYMFFLFNLYPYNGKTDKNFNNSAHLLSCLSVCLPVNVSAGFTVCLSVWETGCSRGSATNSVVINFFIEVWSSKKVFKTLSRLNDLSSGKTETKAFYFKVHSKYFLIAWLVQNIG